MTQSLNRLFARHPIYVPLFLAVVGFGALAWSAAMLHMTGFVAPLVMGASAVAGGIGVLLLPVGVIVAIRRRRHPIELQCSRCGAVSSACERPFRIERPDHVEYAWVVCSQCGADFTVDRNAVLR